MKIDRIYRKPQSSKWNWHRIPMVIQNFTHILALARRRSVFMLLVVWSAVLLSMSPVLVSLHAKWTSWSGSYSHGYLVVIFALGYALRESLAPVAKSSSPVPTVWLWLLAFGAMFVWLVGYSLQIELFQYAMIPVLLWLTAGAFLPWTVVKTLLAPLSLIYLALPVWDYIVPVLQYLTVVVSKTVVSWLGITAFVDGVSFTLPYGTIVVAGSCSGLAFFLMALTLSSINALMNRLSRIQACISIAVFCLLAILGNWIRVASLIIIAYVSEMKNPLIWDHAMFGWYIFAGVFLLFLIIQRYTWMKNVNEAPYETESLIPSSILRVYWMRGVTVTAFVVVCPALLTMRQPDITDFHALEIPPPCLQVQYSGFDRLSCETVRDEQGVWSKLTLFYDWQVQGKELISGSNRIVDSAFMSILAEYEGMQRLLVQRNGLKYEVRWYFQIGSIQTVSAKTAKLMQFTQLFERAPTVSIVIFSRRYQEG